MALANRIDVSVALYELLKLVVWDTGRGWNYTSRRLQIWTDCPAQPAMYLTQGDEVWVRTTGQPPIRVWKYQIVVYQNVGMDQTVESPGDENDLIMGAIEEALAGPHPGQPETLGGTVHSVKIVGEVLKDAGDLDGQSAIMIPIEVMVP